MMDGCPTSAWNASVGSAIFSPSRGAQEDLRGVEGVSFALLLGPRSLHAEAGSLLSCLDKVSWCFAAGLGFFREGNAYQKDKTARSKGERAEVRKPPLPELHHAPLHLGNDQTANTGPWCQIVLSYTYYQLATPYRHYCIYCSLHYFLPLWDIANKACR